ncbi:MAG: hypothetical protein AB8B36_12620 [Prochlorococcus sp.]
MTEVPAMTAMQAEQGGAPLLATLLSASATSMAIDAMALRWKRTWGRSCALGRADRLPAKKGRFAPFKAAKNDQDLMELAITVPDSLRFAAAAASQSPEWGMPRAGLSSEA